MSTFLTRGRGTRVAVAAVAAVLTAGITACSSSGASSGTGSPAASAAKSASGCSIDGTTVTADQSVAAKLPASVKKAGTLTIGTDPSAPPYDFRNASGQLDGLEVQLGHLLGCQLGLSVSYQTLAFAGILSGVQSGRFDVGMSTISDTSEREKVMNFVDYQTEGTAIVVPKGNPKHVSTIDSLCGLKVAGTAGSIPLKLVQMQSAKCSKAISITTLPNESSGYLAVTSGRVDAFMDTFGTAKYTQQHQGSSGLGLQVLSQKLYAVGYQSIALPKTSDGKQLADALSAAVQALMKSGAYQKLYQHWDLAVNELPQPQINNAAKYEKTFMSLN